MYIETRGQGPALALIHGWAMHGGLFAPLVDRLSDRYTLQDRKSTRLNSSHLGISYAVFCLKKKNTKQRNHIGAHQTPYMKNRPEHWNKHPRNHYCRTQTNHAKPYTKWTLSPTRLGVTYARD